MERNRESRRASTSSTVGGSGGGSGLSSSSRRSSRPKDTSDDDDRMEEVGEPRAWDRPKKDRISTIHGSSNSRSKRRRHVLPQESHSSGRMIVSAEDADESAEDTETAAASEDDDEPPPPSFVRKPVKHRPREDEIVMDIPNVPRKARSWISASSRFLSMSKRQQESSSNENNNNNNNHHHHHHKSPVTTQTFGNGNVSPSFLQKQSKRLKPMGTKFRPAKSPKVLEPCSISDQEAEVAEALFVLARSTPSQSGLLESKVEVRTEKAARRASPSPPPPHSQSSLVSASDTGHSPGNPLSHGNPSNGYTSNSKESNRTSSEAPKRKRPRANVKQEDEAFKQEAKVVSAAQQLVGAVSPSHSPSRLVHPKLESDHSSERNELVSADCCSPRAATHRDVAQDDVSNSVSMQLPENEEPKVISMDQENTQKSESKDQSNMKALKEELESKTDSQVDQQHACAETVKSLSNAKEELKSSDIKIENDCTDNVNLSSRATDENDQMSSKLKIDLMAPPPMKHILTEDSQEKPICNDSSQLPSGSSVEAACRTSQESSKEVLKDSGKGMEPESGSLPIKQLDERNFDLKQDSEGPTTGLMKTELPTSSFHVPKEGDRDRTSESLKFNSKIQKEDAGKVSHPSAPSMLTGWIGGLPQMSCGSYYSPGGTPWAAGGSIPNPNIDLKAAHPAMQMPHAAIIPPTQRMKRCATHVYLAHFIYREQRISHSLWSAAICRTSPYNLNIPPVNIHDNEKMGAYVDASRKSSAPQSALPYGYSVSQGSSLGISGCGPTATVSASNHSNAAGVIDTSGGSTTTNVIAAQQYLQAMMQQNGFPSFPFPFTGPPSQGAQFFNTPFFPPHLMPPLPQLQSMTQTPGSVHPLQKQQQGMGSSAPGLTPPTQQLQLQLTSQASASQQLQHNHMATTAQCFGSRSDKDNSVAENISISDNKLCAVQRNMSDQGVANLPNLNISPSMMLATNVPAIHSHDQDFSASGGKQSNTSHQLGGQIQGSGSPAMQQQTQFIQHNVGSGPNLQKKVLDQTISHAYSNMSMPGSSRATVGPGTHGVVPVGSIMAAQAHGLLPDNARVHVQQQPTFNSTQQYQRNMSKGTPGEDVYTAKGQDCMEDKKQSIKHVGTIPQFNRVEMETSSSSIQGSPTSSGGPQMNRMGTPNAGRTLNSAFNPDSRNTRTTSGGSTGQVPIVQSQTPKQNINRSKVASGTNLGGTIAGQNMSGYADKGIPGTIGKFTGTVLYPGQQGITTNPVPKQNQANMSKSSQRTSQVQTQQVTTSSLPKSQMQQMRTVQQSVVSTPPRMMPAASQAALTSVNLPMPAAHSVGVPKSAPGSTNKSPSNAKGSVSASKTTPPKKSSGTGSVPGNMPPGQNMPNKTGTAHQKNQGLPVPQFQQQQPLTQQQRMTTKNQNYTQLQSQQNQYNQSPYRSQVFIPQQSHQYMQQPPGQQQLQQSASQTPSPVHHYQSNSQSFTVCSQAQPPPFCHDTQTTQHFQPAPSPASSNVLSLGSPNINMGSSMMTTVNNPPNSEGVAVKAAYNSGSAMPDINPSGYPTGVTQTNSPHSGSSPFMQPAIVKSVDQKSSPDGTDHDDIKNGRHIASSPSQSAVTLNPLSS